MAAAGAHLLIRAAGVILVAAALAGCGGASGASLDEAADATAAETSRFEMRYRIVNPNAEGEDFEFEAEGLFDYPAERGLMRVEGHVPIYDEDAGPTEFRLLGSTGYTRWIVKRKSYWVKEDDVGASDDPIELLIPFPGGPTQPTDVLTRVLLASEEQREVGKAHIRGTTTTHYRARVDLEKLVKQIPVSQRPTGDLDELWGARFVPVDIWIDDESRLRRITIEQAGKEENGPAEMTTTVELYDYGVEVDVQPPPAEELISQEELDKLTGNPLVVEESGELSPEESCAWARENLPKKDAEEVCSPPEDMEDP